MKKSLNCNLILILIILCITIFTPTFFSSTDTEVYAETSVTIPNSDDGIPDTYLYNALVSYYNENNGSDADVTELSSRLFNDFTDVNLKGCYISDLTGFNKLYMPNLTTLNLSYNSITSLSADTLKNASSNLTTIWINNNNLSSINVATCSKLHTLWANCNSLTVANCSSVKNDNGSGKAYINLANNKLNTFENIIVPRTDGMTIDIDLILHGNAIFEDIPNNDIINYLMGLQGLNGNENQNITSLKPCTYQKLNIENLVLTFTDNNDSTNTYTINDNSVTTKLDLVKELGFGNFSVTYTLDGSELYNENEINETLTYSTSFYITNNFKVLPACPIIRFNDNGTLKTYSELGNKIKSVTTIKLLCNDEDAVIYYKFASQEDWTQGTELTIASVGTFNLQVKAICNNVESETTYLTIRTSSNLFISDTLLLIIVILIILGLIFGVVPLIRKYVMHK